MEERFAPTFVAMRVGSRKRIADISRFRARVWQATAGIAADAFPDGIWRDDHDDRALHWIVLDEQGELVGAARLLLREQLHRVPDAFQYQRYRINSPGLIAAPDMVVVCPSSQRRGIASALLAAQDEAGMAAGAAIGIRQASPRMTNHLAARGWRALGPALPDRRFPGIEFVVSAKGYSRTAQRVDSTEFVKAIA